MGAGNAKIKLQQKEEKLTKKIMKRTTGEQILLASSMSSISGICKKEIPWPETLRKAFSRNLQAWACALASMLHAQAHGCMGHLYKLL